PVDTMVPGVFLAGTVQGPKDIPDTVNQASAAAARAIGLLNKGKYYFDPLYAIVHEELCTKCGKCDSVCPYGAISMNKDGIPVISKTTCTGCGICLETCPTGALDLTMYSNKQLISEANIAGQDKDGSPRIVIFADDMTSYRMIDTVGISKLQYSTNTRVIRVHSAGRITPEIILETFIAGADYILIADAEEKSSPFPYSKKTTIKFMEKARKIMDKYGIESSRINAIEFVTIMLPKFLKTVSDIETYLQKNGLISEELRKTLKENLESELWG
ncbi:hydrogenase iron-sulfur subunit, partial [bacterium]|nr:hydrogenase iron-sulfur subunit [bacterium]